MRLPLYKRGMFIMELVTNEAVATNRTLAKSELRVFKDVVQTNFFRSLVIDADGIDSISDSWTVTRDYNERYSYQIGGSYNKVLYFGFIDKNIQVNCKLDKYDLIRLVLTIKDDEQFVLSLMSYLGYIFCDDLEVIDALDEIEESYFSHIDFDLYQI